MIVSPVQILDSIRIESVENPEGIGSTVDFFEKDAYANSPILAFHKNAKRFISVVDV